jgi:hypothetical protein
MYMQTTIVQYATYFFTSFVDFLQIVSAKPFHFNKAEPEFLNFLERLEGVIHTVRITVLKGGCPGHS